MRFPPPPVWGVLGDILEYLWGVCLDLVLRASFSLCHPSSPEELLIWFSGQNIVQYSLLMASLGIVQRWFGGLERYSNPELPILPLFWLAGFDE